MQYNFNKKLFWQDGTSQVKPEMYGWYFVEVYYVYSALLWSIKCRKAAVSLDKSASGVRQLKNMLALLLPHS